MIWETYAPCRLWHWHMHFYSSWSKLLMQKIWAGRGWRNNLILSYSSHAARYGVNKTLSINKLTSRKLLLLIRDTKSLYDFSRFCTWLMTYHFGIYVQGKCRVYFLHKQKQYVQAPSLTCTICPREKEEKQQWNLLTAWGTWLRKRQGGQDLRTEDLFRFIYSGFALPHLNQKLWSADCWDWSTQIEAIPLR